VSKYQPSQLSYTQLGLVPLDWICMWAVGTQVDAPGCPHYPAPHARHSMYDGKPYSPRVWLFGHLQLYIMSPISSAST